MSLLVTILISAGAATIIVSLLYGGFLFIAYLLEEELYVLLGLIIGALLLVIGFSMQYYFVYIPSLGR